MVLLAVVAVVVAGVVLVRAPTLAAGLLWSLSQKLVGYILSIVASPLVQTFPLLGMDPDYNK